jgi:protein-S-isoprenylcysteine O-methyltransferase Ste14
MSGWRVLLAIVLLPGAMTVLVPALILYAGDGPEIGFGLSNPLVLLPAVGGAALIGLGVLLMYLTITLFARAGKGTLAPWDPTERLVVAGPYRHVRNPMISGVLSVLLGEGLLLGSPGILICAAVFFVVNAAYIPLVEEPGLVRRFGDDYVEYRGNVPRWIPRPAPWRPDV